MINPANIREYINFLHLKKYSAPATEDLKSRWATVPASELNTQLQGLYQHWGIDAATASLYEQVFLGAQQPPAAAPQPQQYQQAPQYQQPQYNTGIPQQKSSKTPLYIGLVVLLAAIGGFAYYKMANKDTNTPYTTTDTTTAAATPAQPVEQNAVAPSESLPETPTETSGDMDDNDGSNVAVIENLLQAEESRDLSNIVNNFSPDAQQYWDISYPTQNELSARYKDVWKKSENGKHRNIRIEKVGNNTYDMYADYEFFSVKEGVTKAIAVHVRYVFDDNNKIIKTFGVK